MRKPRPQRLPRLPISREFGGAALSFWGLGLAAALLLGSCAAGPGRAPLAPASAPPRATAPLRPAPEAPSGWADLPAEARAFAEELRRRGEAGDWAWISARADPGFKATYPGAAPDDGAYLARLLRSGELAAGAPEEGRGFSPLEPRSVRGIRFEEARLRGPIAIVYGSFLLRNGQSTPFALHILWRLEPPQILGEKP